MGIAHTIARERLCAPLRSWAGGHDTFFGYLLSCPYCVSHWIAFAVVPLTDTWAVPARPSLGWVGIPIAWFLSSIVVVVVAAFLRVGFWFLDESQGLVRRRQRILDEELEDAGSRPPTH